MPRVPKNSQTIWWKKNIFFSKTKKVAFLGIFCLKWPKSEEFWFFRGGLVCFQEKIRRRTFSTVVSEIFCIKPWLNKRWKIPYKEHLAKILHFSDYFVHYFFKKCCPLKKILTDHSVVYMNPLPHVPPSHRAFPHVPPWHIISRRWQSGLGP